MAYQKLHNSKMMHFKNIAKGKRYLFFDKKYISIDLYPSYKTGYYIECFLMSVKNFR